MSSIAAERSPIARHQAPRSADRVRNHALAAAVNLVKPRPNPGIALSQVQVAARGITARKVVAQLLAALRRCGSVLANVLPPAAHVAVASALLESTLTSIIGALSRSSYKCL